jgi:HK97 family phage prohead protease
MAIRENREYRQAPMFEVRAAAEGEEKSYEVSGYATTFNDEYVLFESDGIQYKEQILADAIDENTDLSDVIFVKDHEGTVFARTRNNTLVLEKDEHGLKVRADMSKTPTAREAFEEIAAGMYDQMSFAFTVDDDEYNSENHLRTIRHIKKLYDTSFVSFPANPGTDIGVATRSRFDGFIEAEQAERLEREKRLNMAKARYNYQTNK